MERPEKEALLAGLRQAYDVMCSASYWLVAESAEGEEVKARMAKAIASAEELLQIPEDDRSSYSAGLE